MGEQRTPEAQRHADREQLAKKQAGEQEELGRKHAGEIAEQERNLGPDTDFATKKTELEQMHKEEREELESFF